MKLIAKRQTTDSEICYMQGFSSHPTLHYWMKETPLVEPRLFQFWVQGGVTPLQKVLSDGGTSCPLLALSQLGGRLLRPLKIVLSSISLS